MQFNSMIQENDIFKLCDICYICGVCDYGKSDFPHSGRIGPQNEESFGNKMGGDSPAVLRGKSRLSGFYGQGAFQKHFYGRRRFAIGPENQQRDSQKVEGGPGRENGLVVDANVLLSCFSLNSFTRSLLFRIKANLFAPDFLKEELSLHELELFEKSKLNSDNLHALKEFLFSKIEFLPPERTIAYREQAKAICPDPNDIPYFEVALFMGIPLWSNDLNLKNQSFVQVLTTVEIAHLHF